MADAVPVTKENKAELAPADERVMEPAAPLPVKAKVPDPVVLDKKAKAELEASAEAARKEGKNALVMGNAVRVDN